MSDIGGTPPPQGQFSDMGLILHDAYLGFLAAGFEAQQAIYLVGQMLTTLMQGQTPPPD